MNRWQYCILGKPEPGPHTLIFSHSQGDALVRDFAAALGPAVKPERSNAGYLELDFAYAPPVRIAGMLGERGWELVSHAVDGGREFWTFKKQY
jgi:hypothetical protein